MMKEEYSMKMKFWMWYTVGRFLSLSCSCRNITGVVLCWNLEGGLWTSPVFVLLAETQRDWGVFYQIHGLKMRALGAEQRQTCPIMKTWENLEVRTVRRKHGREKAAIIFIYYCKYNNITVKQSGSKHNKVKINLVCERFVRGQRFGFILMSSLS